MEKFTFAQADAYTTDLDNQYRERLRRYVLSLMGEKNEEEAEDIVQNTFINVCASIRSKRSPLNHPYAYLCRVAQRQYSKSSSGQKSIYIPSGEEETADRQNASMKVLDDHNTPDVAYELKERVENVTEQIRKIPQEAVRTVMELLSQGSNVPEIAQQLKQSPKTTHNNVRRGRAYLRQLSSHDNSSSTSEGEKL